MTTASTNGSAFLRALGGAAGFGLKRNVKDLYRSLSRVYDAGDRIYLFGFQPGRVHRANARRFHRAYPVHTNVPIEFIGVWDTVDAVGMPFALAGLVNRFIYQFKFPTHTLGTGVRRAYHALAIDDARQAFEPVLWVGPDDRFE